MNALHALAVHALAFAPASWPCGRLLWWLWRHRHVKPSAAPQPSPRRYRRPANPQLPRSHHRRKPAWVVPTLLRMKAMAPDHGCIKIAANFNRRFAHSHQTTVSKTFVAEAMRKHRYEIERLRRQCKRRVPQALPRNRVWALDCTGKGDERGNVHAIAGLIDHGSRRALALEPLRDRTAAGLLTIVIAATERFGRPRALRTDNDAVFKSAAFEAGLQRLGIKHQFSAPGCPWQNGRIERLFGTLKDRLDRLAVFDVQGLGQALTVFMDWYNEVRPHNHLNGLTPREAWEGVDPYRIAPKHVELFDGWDGLLTGWRIRR